MLSASGLRAPVSSATCGGRGQPGRRVGAPVGYASAVLQGNCLHASACIGILTLCHGGGEDADGRAGKLQFLDKYLAVTSRGSTTVIASCYRDMVDVLEDFLTLRGIGYCRVEKSLSMPSRNNNAPARVLLMTLARAATYAFAPGTVLVLHDVDSGATARVIQRHGVDGAVRILRLVCRYSVEDIIDERLCAELGNPIQHAGEDRSDGEHSAERFLCTLGTDPKAYSASENRGETGHQVCHAAFPQAQFKPCSGGEETTKSMKDEDFWSMLLPRPSAVSDREDASSRASEGHG
jgi:hypothetical protein